MNARMIATVFVCLVVVFAGCAGMNDGTSGDSTGNETGGNTASAASDDTVTTLSNTPTPTANSDDGTPTPTANSDDGTPTQSTVAGGGTPTGSATSAATNTPTATTQSTTGSGTTTPAASGSSDGKTTTTDTTSGTGDGNSASLSNPFTEGEYYRITVKIGSSSRTFETTFEWRVLSVDGEQVTIKVTNTKTGKSTTTQSDWRRVASNLNTKSISSGSIIPLNIIYPLLRAPAVAAQAPSITVTGTDTVAGVTCKKIELSEVDAEIPKKNGEVTACVNKDVPFALHVAVSASGKTTMTITVEEYRSGGGG